MNINKLFFLLIVAFLITSGCGQLKTEFYTGETKHLYTEGKIAYESKDYDKAEKCFKKIIKLDPEYAPAFVALGNIALINEEFKAAEHYYRKSITTNPDLKAKLIPLLLLSMEKQTFKKLQTSGVSLKNVFDTMSSGNDIDSILKKEIPLDLLARDTRSLSLKEHAKLIDMVVNQARKKTGFINTRLFYGYFLFYTENNEWLSADILKSIAPELSLVLQQDTYMKIAALHKRMGQGNKEITYYLKAVKAGKPMSEVAPLLAEIYGIPVEEILRSPKETDALEEILENWDKANETPSRHVFEVKIMDAQ